MACLSLPGSRQALKQLAAEVLYSRPRSQGITHLE